MLVSWEKRPRSSPGHKAVAKELRVDLSVIVPCYNEEASLSAFLDVCVRDFGTSGLVYELILVNDGSRDATSKIMADFAASGRCAHVSCIDFSRNFGKEAALLAGLQEARGDACSFIDADLQQLPSTLLEMHALLMENPDVDVVAAYQEQREGSKMRASFSRSFYGLFNRLSETEIEADASDFRVFRRPVAQALLSAGEYYRFTKGLFSWVGFKTLRFAYVPEERVAGTSKWSFKQLMSYAFEGIISFSTAPLRLSMGVGIVAGLVGFVYLLKLIIVDVLILHNTPAGYPTLLAVVLILGGLILLALGIIGTYLARSYMEVKRRPIYIARSVVRTDDGEQTSSEHFRTNRSV